MFFESLLLHRLSYRTNQQKLAKERSTYVTRSIFWILQLLLLSSCTSRDPAPMLEWGKRHQILQELNNYQARGTFTYRYQGKTTHARFFWRKDGGERFQLRLIHPLGKTLFCLERTLDGYSATDARGNRLVGAAAKLAAFAELPLQMEQISDLLIGLPGTSDKFELDNQQHVKRLITQSGKQKIQVDYLSFHDKLKLQLPAKIQVLLPDRKILVRIDDWKYQL